eukprot:gnl/TRDRNA2_/TRDRNA2_189239_c0_seq1.p1 gnl/TRDRNA2_/TRDRNA2_189239_c0~~gnl/TRDRNA2_/TRDRNA2_189239_c0_seq1.p1  ORF type:complete len:237 (+),score=61.72 gnl/TRDRNA2_/TRDRNA2_189239_c0_seq1:128-838(+)
MGMLSSLRSVGVIPQLSASPWENTKVFLQVVSAILFLFAAYMCGDILVRTLNSRFGAWGAAAVVVGAVALAVFEVEEEESEAVSREEQWEEWDADDEFDAKKEKKKMLEQLRKEEESDAKKAAERKRELEEEVLRVTASDNPMEALDEMLQRQKEQQRSTEMLPHLDRLRRLQERVRERGGVEPEAESEGPKMSEDGTEEPESEPMENASATAAETTDEGVRLRRPKAPVDEATRR